jgi:predicted nucleotidyltransferase
MENLKLDSVRHDIRKIIEPYLKKLLSIRGENIVSILLYGSATGETYAPRRSDINLMVIFKGLGFEQLKSSLKLVNSGIHKKITAPLFLSLEHIETSKDVFPVEFLEIKENHILLYGKDLFGDMRIDQSNIRPICEREIKGKLIRMREAYLEIGLRKKGMEALVKKSMDSFFPIFRALIKIKHREPAREKKKVIEELAGLYNLDKNIFIDVLEGKIDFEKYMGEIAKLAAVVDKL